MGEVSPAERDDEEKPQRRGLRVHLRRLRTLLDLRKLEAAEVVAGRGVGRAADKSGKNLDMPDIVALRLVAEGPDRHVRDHAAAKIADWLVASLIIVVTTFPALVRMIQFVESFTNLSDCASKAATPVTG